MYNRCKNVCNIDLTGLTLRAGMYYIEVSILN